MAIEDLHSVKSRPLSATLTRFGDHNIPETALTFALVLMLWTLTVSTSGAAIPP